MLWGSWIHLCTVIMLQKQSAGSNLKGWLCIHAYLRGKYLNKLEKHILGSLILLNFHHYNHSSFSYDHSQVIYNLPWEAKLVSFSRIIFQPLHEEIAKYYCITSSVHTLSFHNMFHLVHDEVYDEVSTFAL